MVPIASLILPILIARTKRPKRKKTDPTHGKEHLTSGAVSCADDTILLILSFPMENYFARYRQNTKLKLPEAFTKTGTPMPKTIGIGDKENLLIPQKNVTGHLPPMEGTPLSLGKKRTLEATDDEHMKTDRLIPHKSRVLNQSTKRVSSLSEAVVPSLTPPTLPETLAAHSTPCKAPASPSNSSSPPKLHGESTPKPQIQDLRRQETELDLRLRISKARLETLKRAKHILTKPNATANGHLISKWRDAAQKASNYLLNAALEKVNKAGGKQEFFRRETEKIKERLEYTIDSSFQDRISEITNCEEYENLPEAEQDKVLQELDKQQTIALEEAEKSLVVEDAGDDEFTMRDLYKRLKMDYKLVFHTDPPS